MPLHVAFLWHMHQPYYVDPVHGTALMPWVRLHATKGYLDMIWLAERFPDFHCTFNLTPVLLKQIQQLANDEVRAAGQYERNQSQVWAKVGKVNAATKKASASGTLMATLDDADLKAARARMDLLER